MLELQGGLMEHIKKKHKLTVIPFEDTVLAFLVELSELANETRCFKYWSMNQEQSEKTLEEYVDGLHFVLQILIETNMTDAELYITKRNVYSTSELFLLIAKHATQGEFVRMAGRYIALGYQLGFTPEQIEAAYIEKNRINHERQASGY